MLQRRNWKSLDEADHGWLRARYHFRVSADGNPHHRSLGALIVWNDDEIAVGGGFPFHAHRDVEIVTYVRQGVLGHRDTLGSEGKIRAGQIQVMSAGTGIRHAEFNVGEVPLKLYQIWLAPRETGGAPRWEARAFSESACEQGFVVLASGYAEDEGAVALRADARLLGATVTSGVCIRHETNPSRQAYLVVASGQVEVNGEPLGSLDGVAITRETAIDVFAREDSEIVMVDLA